MAPWRAPWIRHCSLMHLMRVGRKIQKSGSNWYRQTLLEASPVHKKVYANELRQEIGSWTLAGERGFWETENKERREGVAQEEAKDEAAWD